MSGECGILQRNCRPDILGSLPSRLIAADGASRVGAGERCGCQRLEKEEVGVIKYIFKYSEEWREAAKSGTNLDGTLVTGREMREGVPVPAPENAKEVMVLGSSYKMLYEQSISAQISASSSILLKKKN